MVKRIEPSGTTQVNRRRRNEDRKSMVSAIFVLCLSSHLTSAFSSYSRNCQEMRGYEIHLTAIANLDLTKGQNRRTIGACSPSIRGRRNRGERGEWHSRKRRLARRKGSASIPRLTPGFTSHGCIHDSLPRIRASNHAALDNHPKSPLCFRPYG
jgi:hypothetical protein